MRQPKGTRLKRILEPFAQEVRACRQSEPDMVFAAQAVRGLSTKETDLIMLFYFYPVTAQTIEDRSGIPPQSTYQELARIKTKIKRANH